MDPRSLQFVAEACAGELRRGPADALVTRVCTDTRLAAPGDLFVALAGERFDAHNFLGQAVEKGVGAMVVERARARQGPASSKTGLIVVGNTREALAKIAGRYRADFTLPIIAVGGSNGKTTTKDLIASTLRQKFTALCSEASFNNDVGVPLTLLNLEKSHAAAVLEVGTNHPGELAPLLRLVQPRFGVITGIGREHLEFFKDLNGVAEEEGWLAELLPGQGTLFINGDSEWTPVIAKRTRATVVRVGLRQDNDWRAENVRVEEAGVAFRVVAPAAAMSGEFRIGLLGRHQVLNALLALAVGTELGVSPEQARRGIASCAPPPMRLQVWEAGGIRVLDDSYNANTDSTLAALQTLLDFPCAGRRVAVLGDMAELGEQTKAAHLEIGRRAAELGVTLLVAVGRWAQATAAAAQASGIQETTVYPDVAGAAAGLKLSLKPGDVVLLKASRAAHFERLGAALRGALHL